MDSPELKRRILELIQAPEAEEFSEPELAKADDGSLYDPDVDVSFGRVKELRRVQPGGREPAPEEVLQQSDAYRRDQESRNLDRLRAMEAQGDYETAPVMLEADEEENRVKSLFERLLGRGG